MDKVTSQRRKHQQFSYESFNYVKDANDLKISFVFKISPDIIFNPRIIIQNLDANIFLRTEKAVIENFIFNLGLIEMFSYWKSTCSPNIEIKAGSLDEKQCKWWKNLLLNGMGEFFYQNSINFKEDNFVSIKTAGKANHKKDKNKHKDRYLVMNSGGRDSVVSLELLKSLKKEVSIFMLNPNRASIAVADTSGVSNRIIVKREIDKKLLDLNQNGYLNGHTPFSAYLAFLSCLCALLFDYKYIFSSNERSANEENVEFQAEKINHQYSKSFEFEKSFRNYVREYLAGDICYLSLLRPLYEIQISKLFAKQDKYFKVFRSCNRGASTNSWCRKCPKCLSIYISLYPFIDENKLIEIFGLDLYEKNNLKDLLLHITGVIKPKPFECVGTYYEILEGLRLSIKKLEGKGQSLPYLLKYAKENILRKNPSSAQILTSWDKNNFLPPEMGQTLETQVKNET